MCAIENDVTIFTNAVVDGGITIGNNVDITAGIACIKGVSDNTIVIGNLCYFINIKRGEKEWKIKSLL